MTTNDELDDFFKKKDRKGKKHTKQSGLLTNNEELLKQLVIVTSATSAFKENMDLDDVEDEEGNVAFHNNHIQAHVRHQQQQPPPSSSEQQHHLPVDESSLIDENSTVLIKNQTYSVKTTTTGNNSDKISSSKLPVQDNTNTTNQQQQQDEWEEFENSNSKYEQLRLKFSRGDPSHFNEDDDEEENFSDDGTHTHGTNLAAIGEDTTDIGNEEQPMRTNRRRDQQQQQQQKEKPAWKLDQLNQQPTAASVEPAVSSLSNQVEETPPSAPKPASSSGVYRPPQVRNSSVTVVSSGDKPTGQRSSKKKEPNLASVEEFPTLGAAINKK